MRFLIVFATLVTIGFALPTLAQQKPPPGAIEQAYTVDIHIDDMEQKLIDRGKACATTKQSNSDKIACRTEMWNIYSARALMKFTCLQSLGGVEPSQLNDRSTPVAKACLDMVNGADNFLYEVHGINNRDSVAPHQKRR